MDSLDRSRQGEDVGVGLAHVGGLVQAVDGLKGCAGLVKSGASQLAALDGKK